MIYVDENKTKKTIDYRLAGYMIKINMANRLYDGQYKKMSVFSEI